jgi:hypothetical protein
MKTNQLIPVLILTTICAFDTFHAPAQTAAVGLREAEVEIEREAKHLADATVEGQRHLERNVREMERHIQLAQNQASQAIATAGPALKRAFGASIVNAPELPLVVASLPLEPAALAELREDLTVMARLVNDALSDDREDHSVRRAMGIVVNWLPGSATADNLYIQGHGAIVQTSVRFPLAPPKKDESAKPAEAPKNSAWESARHELFGQNQDADADVVFPPENREEYNVERIETLKKAVLKALANASNFRRLAGDETVTVVVRSRATARSQIVLFRSQDPHGRTQPNSGEADATMTIRVKKSDADALAAGKINEDEFRNRARVAIY